MLQLTHTNFTVHNPRLILINLRFREFCLADCNFDTGTICSYQNGAGQFNWKVQRGRTLSSGTGPTSDVSGTGKLPILFKVD